MPTQIGRTRFLSVFMLLVLAAALGDWARAQTPSASTQPVPSGSVSLEAFMAPTSQPVEPLRVQALLVDRPDERVALMSNGMQVILKQYKVAPIVAVRMYVRTGSIYEDPFLGAGLSHLFEHLLHGGATTTRSEEQSQQLLLDIGGDSNAYTTYDHTCYYINTASKYLDRAVDLLGDWITRPPSRTGPSSGSWGWCSGSWSARWTTHRRQLQEMTMRILFADHPAQFPVIGYKQDIQSLTKSDVVNYWRDRYIPDNVIVSICGDIDLDATQATVLKHFADFQRRPLNRVVLPEAPAIVSPRGAAKKMELNAAILAMAGPASA